MYSEKSSAIVLMMVCYKQPHFLHWLLTLLLFCLFFNFFFSSFCIAPFLFSPPSYLSDLLCISCITNLIGKQNSIATFPTLLTLTYHDKCSTVFQMDVYAYTADENLLLFTVEWPQFVFESIGFVLSLSNWTVLSLFYWRTIHWNGKFKTKRKVMKSNAMQR